MKYDGDETMKISGEQTLAMQVSAPAKWVQYLLVGLVVLFVVVSVPVKAAPAGNGYTAHSVAPTALSD